MDVHQLKRRAGINARDAVDLIAGKEKHVAGPDGINRAGRGIHAAAALDERRLEQEMPVLAEGPLERLDAAIEQAHLEMPVRRLGKIGVFHVHGRHLAIFRNIVCRFRNIVIARRGFHPL